IEALHHELQRNSRQREEELERLRGEAERQATLQDELAQSQARLEESENIVSALSQRLAATAEALGTAEARADQLSREIRQLQDDAEQARAARAEAESHRAAVASQAGRLADLEARLAEVTQNYREAQAYADRLKGEMVAGARGGGAEVARLFQEVERWQTDLKAERDLRNHVEKALQDYVLRADRAETQVQNLSQEVESLRPLSTRAQTLEQEISALRASLHERESVVQPLTEEISAVSQTLGETRATLAAERERTARLESELESRDGRIRELERRAEPGATALRFDDTMDETEGVSFVPEVLENEPDRHRDPMVDTLFRFLEPGG
ncbi:MAG: hypothetical protein HY706_08480, partial [Candidatus Hydrogenedentes bacterium]|nr:hypothetical protein [Candidatus Hydrogenedentota bacterium]